MISHLKVKCTATSGVDTKQHTYNHLADIGLPLFEHKVSILLYFPKYIIIMCKYKEVFQRYSSPPRSEAPQCSLSFIPEEVLSAPNNFERLIICQVCHWMSPVFCCWIIVPQKLTTVLA